MSYTGIQTVDIAHLVNLQELYCNAIKCKTFDYTTLLANLPNGLRTFNISGYKFQQIPKLPDSLIMFICKRCGFSLKYLREALPGIIIVNEED